MDIRDNMYRYTQINSSIRTLWSFITGLTGVNMTLDEVKECVDRTYLYINTNGILKGIIGISPDDISLEHLKDIIPTMKMKPKGDLIYVIKYVYANTDEIDGFSTYNILYQLIKQSIIICGDRPLFFISPLEDQELFSALKNNKFIQYKDCEDKKYNIFVKYPIPQVNEETVVPY